MTGAFFVECKEKLRLCDNLNAERASALDFHILANAYTLLRSGRGREADQLIDKVNWPDVPHYDWYHFGSLSWAIYWGGGNVEVGASILSIRFFEGCSASGGEGIAPEVKPVCGAHWRCRIGCVNRRC